MMETGTSLSAADIAAVMGTNRGCDNGGWGDNSAWWIILIVLFAIGGRGFGGYGGFGGFGGSDSGCGAGCATQADVRNAVDQQTLLSKLDQQTYGLADSTYALNNSITSGFHGVDNAICNLGYNVQQGFNTLGHQLSDCCCQTQRAIDNVNYNMATQACDTRNLIQSTTRDIIDNANANNRALLDFLVQDKISTLQAENQSLKLAASQANQNAVLQAAMDANTAEIIRRTGNDCPIPAYVVQPPAQVTFPTNCCGTFTGYSNNNCGCGCGNY